MNKEYVQYLAKSIFYKELYNKNTIKREEYINLEEQIEQMIENIKFE